MNFEIITEILEIIFKSFNAKTAKSRQVFSSYRTTWRYFAPLAFQKNNMEEAHDL